MNNKNRHKCHLVFKLLIVLITALAGPMLSSGQTIAIAPIKMNVFYIGVDNPVSVAASGGTDDNVTVTVKGGEAAVSKVSLGIYNVRVAKVTDECWMNVYVKGKWAGSSKFRVRNLPVPSATIGGFNSGDKIAADIFRKEEGIGASAKDFPFEVNYEVTGFTFSIDDDKGVPMSSDCEGALFSAQAREHIDQYLKAGRTITITNIRAKDPGGKELRLPSLVYFMN